MSTFPNFSNIAKYATDKLEARKGSVYNVSKLNSWVRIISGVNDTNNSTSSRKGLVMVSNPDYRLFRAAGDTTTSTIYGSSAQSGVIGTDWEGNPINPNEGQGYRPTPIIDSLEIDEGAGNLSRKASFSVKCFSKEQMELATKYFLEPGFTIFLEWGWNTDDSMYGLVNSPIDADEIASHQNFKNITKRRMDSGGEYDNYLGYITGGGLSTEGDTWTINVNCTGFTELPAYLVNSNNGGAKDEKGNNPQEASDYTTMNAQNESKTDGLNFKRWMLAFNALPSIRKTPEVKKLENGKDDSYLKLPLKHAVNYINFDEALLDKLNSKSNPNAFVSFFGGGLKEEKGDDTIDNPSGTKIFDEERFIRFGAFMKIFNTMIMSGLKIGNTRVSMEIDSSNCICSAFPKIFSTDKSKLFIPNENTPKFSLQKAKNATEELKKVPDETFSNVVKYDDVEVKFPYSENIKNGKVKVSEKKEITLMYIDDDSDGIQKEKNRWGFLDDLYVNFDFVTDIMKNNNLTVKDALYQILNGMSSAVNNLWDFQIIEESTPGTVDYSKPNKFISNSSSNTIQPQQSNNDSGEVGLIKLSIKELNFTYKPTNNTPYEFDLIGTNSIFKDSSLSMDISGAKMDQIIGTRLKSKINKNDTPNLGKLFAKDLTDLVLTEVNRKKEVVDDNTGNGNEDTTELSEDELEELREENYLNFLDKIGIYPKVDVLKENITNNVNLEKHAYKATYDNGQLLKTANSEGPEPEVSILMPINFSFSIHGISGIKRGDKFKVNGIPDKYAKQGFFQVIGVKHTISGMNWTTEVEGGYRNTRY